MLWLCQLPINNNDWEYNFNFPVADQTHGISLIWSTRSLYLWHSTHDIVDLTLLTHAEEDRARWSLIDLLIPWNSFKQQLPLRSLREDRISPLKVTLTWLSNPYHSCYRTSVSYSHSRISWMGYFNIDDLFIKHSKGQPLDLHCHKSAGEFQGLLQHFDHSRIIFFFSITFKSLTRT